MIPSTLLWHWLDNLCETRDKIVAAYQTEIKLLTQKQRTLDGDYSADDVAEMEVLVAAHPVLTPHVYKELSSHLTNTDSINATRKEVERLLQDMKTYNAAIEEINRRLRFY